MKRKAQAAMGFLMTYGWALLVVLIAIAALAFFGLLNPSQFLPEKCEVTPGITCLDFTARTDDEDSLADDENDNITILLNNGIGQAMDTVTINVTLCARPGDKSGYDGNATISSIPEGGTARFEIPCKGMLGDARFRSDMKITYNTTIEGEELDHSKSGLLIVQVDEQ